MRTIVSVLPLLWVLFFTACSHKQYEDLHLSEASFKKVSWEDLSNFEKDNHQKALETFRKTCQANAHKELFAKVCKEAIGAQDAKEFFMEHFVPFGLVDEYDQQTGLITGYYEPLLHGSRTKSKKYQHPIYKVPDDLYIVSLQEVYPKLSKYRLRGKIEGNRIVPYDSREQISTRQDLEAICYVSSDIDLFFLHIQGSGKVQLDTGEIINVGYGGQNGRKYYSIGRKLIEIGALSKEEVSLQSIAQWLEQNPHKKEEIFNLNESYVFFVEKNKGATGSLGVELTPKRTLAVDTKYIPLGLPVFVHTSNPITKEQIQKLMVAADTGGAIKGEIRADFFWGFGKKAKQIAGTMKEEGKLYLLVPKQSIKGEID